MLDSADVHEDGGSSSSLLTLAFLNMFWTIK